MKMIDPKKLAEYLRNDVHVRKAAELVEKYAERKAVDAVPIGDPLPAGTVVEIYKKDDGKQWMRIRWRREVEK